MFDYFVSFNCRMVFAILLLFSLTARAGVLVVQNISSKLVTCQVDGYVDNKIEVKPNELIRLSPEQDKIVNWVKCDQLEHRNIGVTPKSSDHFFLYNGQGENVLSVLLYPYLPTFPYGDFSTMLKRIVSEFQKQNPRISLNVVMSRAPEFDVYTSENFSRIFGKDGFDVVEVDTMLLEDLVDSKLILPVKDVPIEAFWKAAIEGASYKGKLFGIPSWMCMEFLFAHYKQIKDINTLSSLSVSLNDLPQDRQSLIGDFNGKWIISPLFLNAHTHLFGYEGLREIPYNVPRQEAIENLVRLTKLCDYKGENKCASGYYHNLEEGEVPKLFAQNGSHVYVGFSENSFYIHLFSKEPFYATPVPFGKEINTLTYTDAYVANASRCNNDRCLSALSSFASYMNEVETRRWIVYGEDLDIGIPRKALPAIKKFYEKIKSGESDGIYEEFAKISAKVRATPHVSKKRRFWFNNEIYNMMKSIQIENHHDGL